MQSPRSGSPLIPEDIQRTSAYLNLSYIAHHLLKELAWQHHTGTANGDLIASWTHMQPKGMPSSGTLQRCLVELLDARLIVITEPRRGRRPQRYALAWKRYEVVAGDGAESVPPANDSMAGALACR